MTNNLPLLSGLLEDLCGIQEKLLSLENEKTGILLRGDVQALTALMNAEQALVMSCGVVEKKREAFQKDPDLAGKTLREIVAEYAQNDEYSLSSLHLRLSTLVAALKKVSVLNEKLLSARLQTIRHLTTELGLCDVPVTYQKR